MSTLSQVSLQTEEQARAEQVWMDKVIAAWRGRPGALLGILEAVQERNPHNHLPLETLRYVALKTETPLSRIYSVATFYALFNLQPQGENTICICRGTACPVSSTSRRMGSISSASAGQTSRTVRPTARSGGTPQLKQNASLTRT